MTAAAAEVTNHLGRRVTYSDKRRTHFKSHPLITGALYKQSQCGVVARCLNSNEPNTHSCEADGPERRLLHDIIVNWRLSCYMVYKLYAELYVFNARPPPPSTTTTTSATNTTTTTTNIPTRSLLLVLMLIGMAQKQHRCNYLAITTENYAKCANSAFSTNLSYVCSPYRIGEGRTSSVKRSFRRNGHVADQDRLSISLARA